MGNFIGKTEITFTIFAIIVGLYFTHFADFLRVALIKRKKIKLCLPHIFMTITVLLAAIQFIWSFDTMQFNVWSHNRYFNELGNFIFILINSISFYLIGQFLHPDRDDIENEIYEEEVNNQMKFSAIKFYQFNKRYVYIIMIFYLIWTSLSNLSNKYSQDSISLQLIIKSVLVILLIAGLVLRKRTKLDYIIPIASTIILLFYLLVKGYSDFKLLESEDKVHNIPALNFKKSNTSIGIPYC